MSDAFERHQPDEVGAVAVAQVTTRLGCPKCKSTNLATIESLYGSAPLTIEAVADDAYDYQWSGETSVDWNSSETVGVMCRDCGWEHDGKAYEDELVEMRKEVQE